MKLEKVLFEPICMYLEIFGEIFLEYYNFLLLLLLIILRKLNALNSEGLKEILSSATGDFHYHHSFVATSGRGAGVILRYF